MPEFQFNYYLLFLLFNHYVIAFYYRIYIGDTVMKNELLSGHSDAVLMCSLSLSIVGLYESRKLRTLLGSCKNQLSHDVLKAENHLQLPTIRSASDVMEEAAKRRQRLADVQGALHSVNATCRAIESRIDKLLRKVPGAGITSEDAFGATEVAIQAAMSILDEHANDPVFAEAILLNFDMDRDLSPPPSCFYNYVKGCETF